VKPLHKMGEKLYF